MPIFFSLKSGLKLILLRELLWMLKIGLNSIHWQVKIPVWNWSRTFVWAWLRHTLIRLINCNDINNIIHSALNITYDFFFFFFLTSYFCFLNIYKMLQNLVTQHLTYDHNAMQLLRCHQHCRTAISGGDASVIGIFSSHSVWVTVWGRTHNPMHKIIIFFWWENIR